MSKEVITKFRCVTYPYVSQGFYDANACINPGTGNIISKRGRSCESPYINFYTDYLGKKGHGATDRPTPMRIGCYHPYTYNGWLKEETGGMGGKGVDVVSNEPLLKCTEPGCNKTHYIKHRTWHHSELPRREKEEISTGSLVALTGNSGASSGPHVHDADKWCDKDGNSIHKDNGFNGAFDVKKHPQVKVVEDVFVLDFMQVKDEISRAALPKDVLFRVVQMIKSLK